MGFVKKGFLGLEREIRELAAVWREREERDERVAEAVAMVKGVEFGSVRVRVREEREIGRGFFCFLIPIPKHDVERRPRSNEKNDRFKMITS